MQILQSENVNFNFNLFIYWYITFQMTCLFIWILNCKYIIEFDTIFKLIRTHEGGRKAESPKRKDFVLYSLFCILVFFPGHSQLYLSIIFKTSFIIEWIDIWFITIFHSIQLKFYCWYFIIPYWICFFFL
jgi:hypothetical protein